MSRFQTLALSLCIAGLLSFSISCATPEEAPAATVEAKPSGYLLVANKGDQALGIIDPVAGKQIAMVPEDGITGHEVIASPDGKTAYVPIFGNAGVGKPGTDGEKIVVIDIPSQKVVGNIDFGKGVRPHCPQIGPDGMLYVTTEIENSVSIVDPKTLKIVGSIPTGEAESHMLALSSDGKRGYTANVGPGTVSVLDIEARKVIKKIKISGNTQRITLSEDDKLAFTADQTEPRLAVIDTATNEIKRWVELPGIGYGTATTPDGKWLVIPMPKINKVGALNLETMTLDHTIDVPSTPQEALVRPDGEIAYVSCDVDGKIAAIRTSDWKVDKIIEAGKMADGLAWAPAE